MRLQQAIADFGRHLAARERSAHTVQGYVLSMMRFQRFCEGRHGYDPEVRELSYRDLEEHVCFLHEIGLAPRTRRHCVYVLKAFFKFCRQMGVVSASVADELSPVVAPRTLPVYLDASEVALFVRQCPDPLLKAIVGTLYHTGLRISELCTLRLGDLDLDRCTLRVLGKGAKERLVPLNRTARDLLRWYRERIRPRGDADSLFLTKRGRRLNRNWVGTLIRREAQRQGWNERITPHTFRHSHATALYHQGVGLPTIAAILGHASVATTQVYTHLSTRDLREAVERLS